MLDPAGLNLRHLDGLVVAERLGSITAAALAVNLSQPTLTQAIRNLEARLGEVLFERRPAGIRATPAGTILAVRARHALDRLAASCRTVRRTARLPPLAFPERHVSMTQLRSFLAVERAGSHVLAARELGVSQPSVHRAARDLELVLGVPLLERTGRATRPTAAGERMARGARLLLADLRAGLEEVAALQAKGAGRLVIGALPLPRAGLLPQTLARFADAHPWVGISIVEGAHPELLAALLAGEVDLFMGALRPGPAPEGTVQRVLLHDELFVVGRAGHPLAGRDPDATALAAFPWVVAAPGAPMRATWDRLFGDGPRPPRRIRCGSTLVTRGLLLAGDWLALMSPDQFRIEEAAGLLATVGVAVPGSRRDIGVTSRADWRPTPAQAAFMALLEARSRRGE